MKLPAEECALSEPFARVLSLLTLRKGMIQQVFPSEYCARVIRCYSLTTKLVFGWSDVYARVMVQQVLHSDHLDDVRKVCAFSDVWQKKK